MDQWIAGLRSNGRTRRNDDKGTAAQTPTRPTTVNENDNRQDRFEIDLRHMRLWFQQEDGTEY